MNVSGFIQLLFLSAIWGGSFLFMRMTASIVGPAWLILARVGLAAIFLWFVATWVKKKLYITENWRHYFILGLFNSALPFLLFAYAAQTLSASLLSILNATAPIWAAIIAVIWLDVNLTKKKWFGMIIGLLGVIVFAGVDTIHMPLNSIKAIGAGLLATLSYGVATNYAKFAPNIDPISNAHGSMWAATFTLIPLAVITPLPANISFVPTGLSVVTLGVVCSGMAYLIYFKLIRDFGAVSALSVTFLVPIFGTAWGVWLLDEPITIVTIVGGLLILIGTAMVTDFSFRTMIKKRHE